MRPQIVKRAAAMSGVDLQSDEDSVFRTMSTFHQRKVTYKTVHLLYIGLFSRTPNNIYSDRYDRLTSELISKFYEDDPYGDKTLQTLFALEDLSEEGLNRLKETFTDPEYSNLFTRLYLDFGK